MPKKQALLTGVAEPGQFAGKAPDGAGCLRKPHSKAILELMRNVCEYPGCKNALPLDRLQRRAKYCSPRCAAAIQRLRWRKLNPGGLRARSRSHLGAAAELAVAAELLRDGFDVFRSVSPAAVCDLLVLRDGKLWRVEVTSGNRNPSGALTHPTKTDGFDALAVYVHAEQKTFWLPIKPGENGFLGAAG